MSTTNPVLDQPQSVDYELLPAALNWLANQDLHCRVDANSDPVDIYWPWAAAPYARGVRLAISDWQDGPLTPLAVRFFPGHQETIAGAEGMIVTKRLIAPWKSPDDKALIWLLECQAEGDRLLKLEVEIDWGEPLSQRLVDGLLVAQRNPEPARGIYAQSNAESTRVFGNPYGRPDEVDLSDSTRARLVYHVLINGTVEVPLLLTLSDVGEQVAWNGFLSLRDVEQIFDASSENWSRLLRTGRLWTPDPDFNRAVHRGKLEAVRHVQRWRSGWFPSDGETASIPALVNAWDAADPAVSRNLLAHLRRLAEETAGRLPALLPAYLSTAPSAGGKSSDGESADAEAVAVLRSNSAYLAALAAHLHHHGDAELLAAHLPAVRLCSEALIQLWVQSRNGSAAWDMAAGVQALQTARSLAEAAGSEVDAARWESEVAYWQQVGAPSGGAAGAPPPVDWLAAVAMAGAAVWEGCGISCREQEICVQPAWPRGGAWWALLGLPLVNGKHLSLLWDGKTLHATQPVTSSLAVSLCKKIQIHHIDEFDFDPVFELTPDPHTGDTAIQRFKPTFIFK